jgi:hypothetical protein
MREQGDLKEKTAKTAQLCFSSVKDGRPFDLWRSFEKDLARDISIFVTGKLDGITKSCQKDGFVKSSRCQARKN